MSTEKHQIGPFHFTFRNGRCWWRYATNHFGVNIRASGATSISTVDKLRAFLDPAITGYGEDGLTIFVGYHFCDIPGASHWAEHYTRVQIDGPRKHDWSVREKPKLAA